MLCQLYFNEKRRKNQEVNLIASKTVINKENTHSFEMYVRIWSMC